MDTTALSKSNYLFCYIMFSHAYRIYFRIAVGISTPQDSQNFYSEMFELKDAQGIPFFRTIRVSLVCQACQDAGKGSECTHNADLIPPW